MPKAILEFNLPEEQEEFFAATHGQDVAGCVFEFDQKLRSLIKYDGWREDKNYATVDMALEAVRQLLYDTFNEENLGKVLNG